ncbi:MAG: hypothetical protein NVSMB63_14610 [Sediminibacterium sp.]
MTDNQLDNFIRAKLKDHSAPVPPGLWEKIRPDGKDDRKGFYLLKRNLLGLLVIVGFLLVLPVGGYLYFNTQVKKSQAGGTINNSISSNSNNHHTPINENNPNPANKNEAGNAANAVTATDENSRELKTTIASSSTTSVTKNNGASRHSNDPANNTFLADLGNMVNTNTQNNSPFVNKNAAATGQTTAEAGRESEMDEIVNYTGSHLSEGNTIPYNYAVRDGFFDLKNIQDKHISNRPIITCPSIKDGGGNQEWNIEIYASPDLAFKSIQNKTATQQYLQKKDSSERMQIGYTAGFRLVKPITDNFLIKAGLQFSQINEKFTYRTENEVKTTTVVTQRTIIRGPGDTVVVSDTSVLRQIGYRTNTVNNHFRSIDIPVTLGYQFGDDDLHFGINAGVILNLSSWYRGVVLDSSLATVPISKGTNPVYKNNIGMGLYAGFSILKRINDDTHLFFEPYFRYNLSGITTDQSSYNQKFNVGGLSIGLRYNLNRR